MSVFSSLCNCPKSVFLVKKVNHCSLNLLLSLSLSLFIFHLVVLFVSAPAPSRPRQGSVLQTHCGWEIVACKAHSGPRAVAFAPL